MYVSFTAMYVGMALALGVWWPLLLLPVVIAVLTVAIIAREERYMRATFGAAYEDYCRRVRRWI
jgi:protein-S-isoprenylcysteine O-methyltransferase Ste14